MRRLGHGAVTINTDVTVDVYFSDIIQSMDDEDFKSFCEEYREIKRKPVDTYYQDINGTETILELLETDVWFPLDLDKIQCILNFKIGRAHV